MELLFYIALPLIAFLYASVGHGGASGYLALMVIFSFASEDIRIIALILNLFVAGISFYHFKRAKHFNFKLFYPFVVGSIPAAFIGGMLEIDSFWYKRILGIFLLIATIRFILQKEREESSSKLSLPIAMIIGAAIGLFSGMIGIGGGIILSPVILLLGWGNIKETAAVSALFIFVNSAFGLAGNFFNDFNLSIKLPSYQLILIISLAIFGGFAGSLWGSKLKTISILKYVLASVLAIASVKLWVV